MHVTSLSATVLAIALTIVTWRLYARGIVLRRDLEANNATRQELGALAWNDSLTELPNRHFLLERLREGLARSARSRCAEALVRWQHPERGMISPADFIALAEETGLIIPLGNWVLETACRQLATWQADPGMAHLSLAVNVSVGQFREADFVAGVQTILGKTGAPAHQRKIELTESLLAAGYQRFHGYFFGRPASCEHLQADLIPAEMRDKLS